MDDKARGIIKSMAAVAELCLQVILDNEWQTRNAAENRYCQYCSTEDERFADQHEHHDGCKWAETVAFIREMIAKAEDAIR